MYIPPVIPLCLVIDNIKLSNPCKVFPIGLGAKYSTQEQSQVIPWSAVSNDTNYICYLYLNLIAERLCITVAFFSLPKGARESPGVGNCLGIV